MKPLRALLLYVNPLKHLVSRSVAATLTIWLVGIFAALLPAEIHPGDRAATMYLLGEANQAQQLTGLQRGTLERILQQVFLAVGNTPEDDMHRREVFTAAMDSGLSKEQALRKVSEFNRSLEARFFWNRIAPLISLLFLIGIAAIVLRRISAGCKRFIPRTHRAKQFAVFVIVGSWCSACCLLQVLNPEAIRHPVRAAVTALLWAIQGLIAGAVWMWWLSPPLLDDAPTRDREGSERAAAPNDRTQENTRPARTKSGVRFRWGKIQGWVILVLGALDLLDGHPILLGNMYGRLGCILLIVTGIALLRRNKAAVVLFFVCDGALLGGFLWEFRFRGFGFGAESSVLLGILLAWWLLPALLYYPKRWKEFPRKPVIAALIERR